MVSARRQKRIVHKKRVSLLGLVKYLILLLIPVLVFSFVKLTTKDWNGEDKVSLVYPKENGDVGVAVIDPDLEEITNFNIPADTEIEVARNLGTLKIRNVWQLGINEKLGGDLLAQTITKDFLFPTHLWSGDLPTGLSDMNLVEALRFVFLSKDTNIAFGDRVSIGMFVVKATSIEKNNIDLGKSQFLTKSKLSDGSLGYKIPGEISERLTFYFADNDFSQSGIRIYIKDSTGVFGVSERVGNILEVMGAKVVSVERMTSEGKGCEILGGNKEVIKKISKLFKCEVEYNNNESDVEIKLGSEFAKRF